MPLLCVIEGCKKPQLNKRGWCSAHYNRWRRHGNPLAGRTSPGSGLEWISDLVKRQPNTMCVDWPFGLADGRATLGHGQLAGWIVMELCGHPKPEAPNNYLLHSCDRPICVAPWHLSWGSQEDNMRQASERGRMKIGSSNGYSKLTEEDVIKIRDLYAQGMLQKDIAELFNINQVNVSVIVLRKTWKHV